MNFLSSHSIYILIFTSSIDARQQPIVTPQSLDRTVNTSPEIGVLSLSGLWGVKTGAAISRMQDAYYCKRNTYEHLWANQTRLCTNWELYNHSCMAILIGGLVKIPQESHHSSPHLPPLFAAPHSPPNQVTCNLAPLSLCWRDSELSELCAEGGPARTVPGKGRKRWSPRIKDR